MKKLLALSLLLLLTACSCASIYNEESLYKEPFYQASILTPTPTPEPTPDPWHNYQTFTTPVQIHPTMPVFTVTHILGDYVEQGYYSFPQPRAVTLIICDENGEPFQIIENLAQSALLIGFEGTLSFDDYNFDGYLDMRLHRWQDGVGGLLAFEYFWLWDASLGQFVLHHQLTALGVASELHADAQSQSVRVWQRNFYGGTSVDYTYYEGEFFPMRRHIGLGFRPNETHVWQAVNMDAQLLSAPNATRRNYEVHISIEIEGIDSDETQEITGLSVSYNNPPLFGWEPHRNDGNPLNFNVVNLLDGNIIMQLHQNTGGSLMNAPHYFWLWDEEARLFVPHEGLRELSNFATVTLGSDPWAGGGRILTTTRISQGLFDWRSYDLINGELVLRQTRERTIVIVDGVYRIKDIITNHTDGTQTVEFVE
ncbi:MAG: hypothetical protein FWC16_02950 [Defluviitaleaceae bacterium]|nr:hypothetical protein [Defluviitaleaceae bacterium]MCL2273859.1 hypothetical protein [Defluviitaleaceae bacterium]